MPRSLTTPSFTTSMQRLPPLLRLVCLANGKPTAGLLLQLNITVHDTQPTCSLLLGPSDERGVVKNTREELLDLYQIRSDHNLPEPSFDYAATLPRFEERAYIRPLGYTALHAYLASGQTDIVPINREGQNQSCQRALHRLEELCKDYPPHPVLSVYWEPDSIHGKTLQEFIHVLGISPSQARFYTILENNMSWDELLVGQTGHRTPILLYHTVS